MSELKVDTIVNLAGTGKPNLPVAPTLGGTALASANTYIYTSSGTEPSSPKNGHLWWDSSKEKVMLYINGEFKQVTLNGVYTTTSNYGDRGFSFGDDGTALVRLLFPSLVTKISSSILIPMPFQSSATSASEEI